MPERRTAALLLLALLLAGGAPAYAAKGAAGGNDDLAARAYLQGRLALSDDDYAAATRLFGEAMKGGDDDAALRQSFDAAMLSGDLKAAVRLAGRVELESPLESSPESSAADSSAGRSIFALVKAAEAARKRDWRGYDAAVAEFVSRNVSGMSEQLLGVSMEAWGKAARGEVEAALAIADPSKSRGVLASYLREQRANILALAGRWSEAADAYAGLVSGEGASVGRLRLAAAGSVLEASPNDVAAREKAFLLVGGGAAGDPALEEARTRLLADPRIGGRKLAGAAIVASPQQGIGLLFVRFAADLVRTRSLGPAIHFGRLATLVDPSLADGWLITSDVLTRAGKYDAALVALDSLPNGASWRGFADDRRARILAMAGRVDEARALLSARAERPEATAADWERLADLERRAERPAQAIDAYDRALALPADGGGARTAQLHFLRGSVLESAGDWAEAEPDLRRAVELDGDNPVYLNYLGYSLLDRDGDLAEARDLIGRAFELAPESGAIMDSMGWAEHKAGNGARAVQLLEQAQSAEPSDPTIADHLGDTLWAMGRRIEARHAWTAAAALEPEPPLAEAIRRKLEFGLDVAGPGQ